MRLKSLIFSVGVNVMKLELDSKIRGMVLKDGLVTVLMFNALDGSMKSRFINLNAANWWEVTELTEEVIPPEMIKQ